MANKCFEDRNPLDCSICLDQLHDPVTIPCGHNYCMDCIKDYWDKHGSRETGYGCPQCRETFTPKPVLNKNTMFAEVVERFKKTLLRDSSPTHLDGPVPTECKLCTSQKVCSKCEDMRRKTYPGYNFNDHTREKHTVIVVSADTQGNICSWHNRLQGVNGQTDQQSTCMQCLQNTHKGHEKTQEHRKPLANKQHRSKTGGHGKRKSIRIVHGTGHRHGHSSGHTHGSCAHQNSSGHGVHSHGHSHGAGRRKSRDGGHGDWNTGLGHDRNWH